MIDIWVAMIDILVAMIDILVAMIDILVAMLKSPCFDIQMSFLPAAVSLDGL